MGSLFLINCLLQTSKRQLLKTQLGFVMHGCREKNVFTQVGNLLTSREQTIFFFALQLYLCISARKPSGNFNNTKQWEIILRVFTSKKYTHTLISWSFLFDSWHESSLLKSAKSDYIYIHWQNDPSMQICQNRPAQFWHSHMSRGEQTL